MIYERIKEAAAARGMNIGQLCDASGVKRTAMQEWNEHTPAADKLLAVAKVLGVTMEYLLEPEAGREAV